MSAAPLDQKYLDNIFDRLGALEVHLDSDPLVYGPKRLNQKTALVRQMLTECERMFLEVSQRLAAYNRQHRTLKVFLDLQLKRLLAEDPETRSGRAVSEREAIAYGKLKKEVAEVADTENAIAELDAVMQVIKAKRADLRDIQGRLRDQVRLCQEELNLGSHWGSKSPRGVELQPGQGFATAADVEHVQVLIDTVLQVEASEKHLPAEVDPEGEIGDGVDVLVAGDPVVSDPIPETSTILTPAPTPRISMPETSGHEDVDAFLSQEIPATQPEVKKSRFTQEESDDLNMDLLLLNFRQ